MNSRIPQIANPGEFHKTDFTESPLVEIQSDARFEAGFEYAKLGMAHAVTKCLVREEVYEKLILAHSFLPEGYRFYIYDAWRPFLLQEELYRDISEKVIHQFHLENAPEEEQLKRITAFVSVPRKDTDYPPVHTTGGAVDLTILDAQGRFPDMGSAFDEISERSDTVYIEEHPEETNAKIIRKNRRLLYNAMTKAGFTNLPSEWWHYDFGDRFWAYYTGKPAMYRGVFEKTDLKYS